MHLELTGWEERLILLIRRLGWLGWGDVRIRVENGQPIVICAGQVNMTG